MRFVKYNILSQLDSYMILQSYNIFGSKEYFTIMLLFNIFSFSSIIKNNRIDSFWLNKSIFISLLAI